jgi:serine/threonine-protein kinase
VSAQRDWTGYRLAKFVQRNKAEVTASALMLLSLFGGIVGTGYQARVAERERRRGVAVSEFLSGMLGLVPAEKRDSDMTVRQVLDEAATRIDTALASQPQLAAELRHMIGNSYLAIGYFESADKQFRAALALYRASGKADEATIATLLSDIRRARQLLPKGVER